MDNSESPAGGGKGVKQRGGDPLAAMYILAALLMAVAAGVVILLMFVGDGSSSSDTANLWIPGSGPGWQPLGAEQADFAPPGLVQVDSLEYVAVIEAYNWTFRPSEIRVPVGSTVTFRARSVEDYHGIAIIGTPIVLSLPKATTEVSHTFTEAGEYPILCAEYCGAGHVNMTGRVIVE
jgi:plastocyanin